MTQLSQIQRFDALMTGHGHTHERPTAASLAHIQAHFGIRFPNELIQFARDAAHFHRWFASLGPDYDNPHHIIRINSYWRRRRPKRRMPRHLIAFNLGFDGDLDCFDLSMTPAARMANGEHAVRYWSADLDNPNDVARYDNFHACMASALNFWEDLQHRTATRQAKRAPTAKASRKQWQWPPIDTAAE